MLHGMAMRCPVCRFAPSRNASNIPGKHPAGVLCRLDFPFRLCFFRTYHPSCRIFQRLCGIILIFLGRYVI